MKKFIALLLAAVLTLALAACGSKNNDNANTDANADNTNDDSTKTTITGTVATDGSTSMEKVIGALSESFMANNADTPVTYNPTGSGSGITAVSGAGR